MSSGNKLYPHRFELAKDWKKLTQKQRDAVADRFRIKDKPLLLTYDDLNKKKPKIFNSNTLFMIYPRSNPSLKVRLSQAIGYIRCYIDYLLYRKKFNIEPHNWEMAKYWVGNWKASQRIMKGKK